MRVKKVPNKFFQQVAEQRMKMNSWIKTECNENCFKVKQDFVDREGLRKREGEKVC